MSEYVIDKLEDLGLRKLAVMNLEQEEKIIDLEDEIERLNNIIKEVREYIKGLKNFKIKYVMFEEKELYASENDFVKELLEILDKGE